MYKDSYDKKFHESWMCEMTHILVKNEENEKDINKTIYLSDTYETIGKIIFNTIVEIVAVLIKSKTKYIYIANMKMKKILKNYLILEF